MDDCRPRGLVYRELWEGTIQLQGLGGVDTYRIHRMMAARVTTAR